MDFTGILPVPLVEADPGVPAVQAPPVVDSPGIGKSLKILDGGDRRRDHVQTQQTIKPVRCKLCIRALYTPFFCKYGAHRIATCTQPDDRSTSFIC